jgi:hypothetical protein
MRPILKPLASLAVATTLCAAIAAHAQGVWPAPTPHSGYGALEVITVSDPGIRYHCRVHSITADAIRCGVGFARKPVIYPRDTVAALVFAPNHSGQHEFFLTISLAVAGTVAAAIFLPPLAAVAIGFPSIYLGLLSAMFTESDSDNESILYQRLDMPTLTLRTH